MYKVEEVRKMTCVNWRGELTHVCAIIESLFNTMIKIKFSRYHSHLFWSTPALILSMENSIQPIKRSEQLAPLSREHHDGLLFAWKLRQGLAKAIPVETLSSYCIWYWKNHIKQHFHHEEDIILK